MNYILLIMLWEISLVFAFAGGYLLRVKKRPATEVKPLTEEDEKALRRIQKENQNFMTYDGTPQDAINNCDY